MAATIETIELINVALPRRRDHKWTGATEGIGSYLLVKMTDSNGVTGWGEATALKDWAGEHGRYFGESVHTTRTVLERHLIPSIMGADPANIADLHARMDAMVKGYPYAKAALDLAAYDLAGKRLGCPSYMLLGGAFRNEIPITHSIGFIPLEEAEREVVQVVGEGIRTIKIKVGVDPDRDVAIVKRIRGAVGEKVELCIDANQGYATPGEAIQTLRRMESCRIKYFEQPVHGISRMAEVARAIDVPVMADESAWNAHDVLEVIEKRAAQIISIYTTKPGGLYRAMEVAAVCRAAAIPCNVNGSLETGVGNLGNLHLAAAAQAVTLSCVVPISTRAEDRQGKVAGIYYTDDLLAESMRLVDGKVALPTGPGFGIAVDDAKLRQFTVRQ
jgi:muconate cycloisomerase